MEFLSETYGEEYSVEFTSRVGKWYFYEQVIKVPRYVIFRAKTARLEVYALESIGLQLAKNGSPELMVISLSNQKSKLIRDS